MKLIKLTRGKFTMVDDADYDWLNQWKWNAAKKDDSFYAVRQNGNKKIKMHRLILGLNDPKILGDHRDRNGLNNQRYNLRQATHTQNRHNSSGFKSSSSKFKGVSWDKNTQKWRASIRTLGKKTNLGFFKLESEAAIAYDNAAKERHGEYANLNIFEKGSPVAHLEAI